MFSVTRLTSFKSYWRNLQAGIDLVCQQTGHSKGRKDVRIRIKVSAIAERLVTWSGLDVTRRGGVIDLR